MTSRVNIEIDHDIVSPEASPAPCNADRIVEVYNQMGKVLESPASFGLEERLPQLFLDTLRAMRESLKAEMADVESDGAEDLLQDELSQDADSAQR